MLPLATLNQPISNHSTFLIYTLTDARSPFRSSMLRVDKSQDEQNEWVGRLWNPYFTPPHVLRQWASEAANEALKRSRLADKKSSENFQKWIEESLDAGARELHASVRNEDKEIAVIHTSEGIVTNINAILSNHTDFWKGHWKSDDSV